MGWVGLGQEQLVIGIFLFLIIFWIIIFRKSKHGCGSPAWSIYGTAGFLIGIIILVAAPGNYIRLSSANHTEFYNAVIIFVGYLFFALIGNAWRDWWPWITCTGILALSMKEIKGKGREAGLYVVLWLSIGLATLLPILFLSSFVVDRAAYFAIVFWNIAVLSILRNRSIDHLRLSPKIYVMIVFLLVNMLFIDTVMGVLSANATKNEIEVRQNMILAAKQNGTGDIVISPIATKFRRTTFISDITIDPEHWLNKAAADYYGVKSLRLSTPGQDYKEIKSGELAQILRSIFQQKYKERN